MQVEFLLPVKRTLQNGRTISAAPSAPDVASPHDVEKHRELVIALVLSGGCGDLALVIVFCIAGGVECLYVVGKNGNEEKHWSSIFIVYTMT